jgi:hypothetical protein
MAETSKVASFFRTVTSEMASALVVEASEMASAFVAEPVPPASAFVASPASPASERPPRSIAALRGPTEVALPAVVLPVRQAGGDEGRHQDDGGGQQQLCRAGHRRQAWQSLDS